MMNQDKFYTQAHGARNIHDAEREQEIFEYIFQPAFRESANLSRTAYFTSFLAWTGKVRELALADIGEQLVEQIATADWGMVTNWAKLQVVGEVLCFERVLARFRIGKVVGAVIPLSCEFYRIRDDHSLEPIARVEQDTTWVEVIGHGKVRPAEFPEYLANYLERTRQRREPGINEFEGRLSRGIDGLLIHQEKLRPGGLPVMAESTFSTSLEESNLVGNVYYANYFIWQGRIRDMWLYEFAPEYLTGNGSDGELRCINSRLDYLRDAMPFDKVRVTASVLALYEDKLHLKFEYYRLLGGGDSEKLAVGQHEAVWVKRNSAGEAAVGKLPQVIVDKVLESIGRGQERLSA
ncbi:MAG: hypothetical protein Tsb002_26890 [Wenzhouxiangellaceae bacterium]